MEREKTGGSGNRFGYFGWLVVLLIGQPFKHGNNVFGCTLFFCVTHQLLLACWVVYALQVLLYLDKVRCLLWFLAISLPLMLRQQKEYHHNAPRHG